MTWCGGRVGVVVGALVGALLWVLAPADCAGGQQGGGPRGVDATEGRRCNLWAPPGRTNNEACTDRFAVGSTYVMELERADTECNQENTPAINVTFYRGLPSFRKVRALAAEASRIGSAIAHRRGGVVTGMVPLLKKYLTAVRPNPGGAPTQPHLMGTAEKLVKCAATWDEHLPAVNSTAGTLRLPKCNVNFFLSSSVNVLTFLSTQTLAHHGAKSFRPRHFVDFGSRHYSSKIWKGASAGVFESSVRWFEAHYPRFTSMTVDVFEVNSASFSDTYAGFADRRRNRGHGRFRFVPAAIWVHGAGVSMPVSDMMSVSLGGDCVAGSPLGTDSCQCFPTVDIAEYMRPHAPRSVVVKMDVEGAEWQLLHRLHSTRTLDRIGELFLECHSLDWVAGGSLFESELAPAVESGGGAAAGALPGVAQELAFRASNGGFDCNALLDWLRSTGIHVTQWP